MQKDNIKNMNNSDRDTITGNDKSSMVITGIDRTVKNAKGVYTVYQGWKGSRLDSTREPIESVHKGNNQYQPSHNYFQIGANFSKK